MEGLSSSGGHRNVDGIQPLAASPTFLTKQPPESQLQVRTRSPKARNVGRRNAAGGQTA